MTDPMLHPPAGEGLPRADRPVRKWLVYGLAIVMLGVCVWVGLSRIEEGWDRLRHASVGDVGLMLATVAANIVLNGFLFWAVLVPFRPLPRVGVGEMTALISATSLLNYLPMRAGLIGRAAYLKQRNGIAYRVSIVMMLSVAALTVFIYALLVGVTVWRERLDTVWWSVVVASLVVASTLSVWIVGHGRRWVPRSFLRYFDDAHDAIDYCRYRPLRSAIGSTAVFMARASDVLIRALLLWTAARVFDTPIEPGTAIVLACAGMFVTIATPLPNGLGLREGIYGLLAAAGVAGDALPDGATGVALGLIERAVEAAVFIVLGSIALAYVHRRTTSLAPDADDAGS